MRIWVAITNNDWYRCLAAQPDLDELSFWHPSGRAPFSTLPEGTPFLFKLKAPHHHIAGGALFIEYVSLPLSVAWTAFGTKTGASSYAALCASIGSHRARGAGEPEIGWSLLGAPWFLPEDAWIPVADILSKSGIQTGKALDTGASDGAWLWEQVQQRLQRAGTAPLYLGEAPGGHGPPRLVRPRRGQGAFRALVTNAYQRRCAITGESTLPALEAAHIRDFALDGANETCNGLLLRADFHKLFDAGLVTVTPEHRVVVSHAIREEWFNGKAYERLHGRPLHVVPTDPRDRPQAELLAWHNDHVFEKRRA